MGILKILIGFNEKFELMVELNKIERWMYFISKVIKDKKL
jgi:hypothetical protein